MIIFGILFQFLHQKSMVWICIAEGTHTVISFLIGYRTRLDPSHRIWLKHSNFIFPNLILSNNNKTGYQSLGQVIRHFDKYQYILISFKYLFHTLLVEDSVRKSGEK